VDGTEGCLRTKQATYSEAVQEMPGSDAAATKTTRRPEDCVVMKDKNAAYFSEDRYGFTWGALTVERLVSDETETGHRVVLGLKTPREQVDIYVTPTGLIRVGKIRKIKRDKNAK
jgi:hypothetical protein